MNAFISTLRRAYALDHWRGKLLLALSILLVLLVIIRIALTPTVIYVATNWLNDQGIDAHIEDIELSILDGTVSLIQASGKKEGETLFNIGRVNISWLWTPLSNKTVSITGVELDAFKLDLELYDDIAIAGGLHIPLASEPADEAEPSTEDVKPWAASLGTVTFSSLEICYLQHHANHADASDHNLFADYCLNIDNITWQGEIAYALDQELVASDPVPVEIGGDFEITGIQVNDNRLGRFVLDSRNNRIEQLEIKGLNSIRLASLQMRQLSALERDDNKHRDAVRYQLISLDDISFENLQALHIGSITIENPGLYIVREARDSWEYQQWIPESRRPGKADKADDSTTDDQQASPTSFKLAIGSVSITEPDMCLLDKPADLYYCFTQSSLDWTGSFNFTTGSAQDGISADGSLAVSETRLRNHRLERDLVVIDDITLAKLAVTPPYDSVIESFTVNGFRSLQRSAQEQDFTASLEQLKLSGITFNNLDRLHIANINIDRPSTNLVKTGSDSWEFDPWIPDRNAEDDTDTKQPADTDPSAFTVSLDNFAVSQPDLCYQDRKENLDYCFKQQSLNWQGEIKHKSNVGKDEGLSATGNLNMGATRIYHNKLSRELLAFNKLGIKKITLTPELHASFNRLDLVNFKAMQRGKDKQDYTSAFDKLAITDLDYKPELLAINTVTLSGLQTHVSTNEDGSMEFEKWLPGDSASKNTAKNASTNANKTGTNNADTTASDTGDKTGKPPLPFRLNRLIVETDRDTVYTDNSTSPPMTVGLASMKLDIAELDPARPDHDSPVSFFAKSLIHATIDVKGTVRPFAEKIAFDIDGELKGFDLKVATPETRKSIGHIIKSGQLDAELDLLATEGQMDSNIALSLYHFHIEPVSDEAAKELDNTLGMPLNRTLVLLRDKDDSIHLDIPITGDVMKPDFNLMNTILKATTKAATVTAITFYTPYGLVYAGGSVLFDLATAMNFDPVLFNPGNADLTDTAREQLDELAVLLIEKPQLHLTICGQTNNPDAYTLFPELAPAKNTATDSQGSTSNNDGADSEDPDNSDTGISDEQDEPATTVETEITLDVKQRATLSAIAHSRQSAVKNFLINEKSIAHDKLILCEPTHEQDDDAVAGVILNI